MELTGAIVFTTVERADYGFDIFSAKLPTNFHDNWDYNEHCLTDGISINFNSQFSDEDETIIYSFDIFSAKVPTNFHDNWDYNEHCLTDGISINFNSQFFDEDETIIYISERTGSSRIYLNRPQISKPKLIQTPTESLFHDCPVINNGRVYYVFAYEPQEKPFMSWSALYSTRLDHGKTVQLTPYDFVDYIPAISKKP
ncbi:tolB protein-related [Abeliophyllum distichum]|uniref:TolB protein-related n=1 Tax=Abeliophyllum distichum TaxID=126358 RepID=A0ABD1TVU7_9LAMI